MTASSKIVSYLKDQKIPFELLEHPTAYTALEIADKQHVKGKMVVKSVIIKVDGKPIMCVLPSIHLVDFEGIKALSGGSDLRLATEEEVSSLFPDYETGAEPPFGQLYGVEVFFDKFLENEEEILFNAGSHTDLIKIKTADYLSLVRPKIAEFGVHI